MPEIVWRGECSVAFVPLDPVTPGHILVVPQRHFASPAGDPSAYGLASCDAARFAAEQPDDFNLIVSSGRDATQTVFHTHIHVVPRREGDGMHLPWTGQKRSGA